MISLIDFKLSRLKRSFVIVLVTLGLSGCIATGIRVGPVFIPVDTGIDKKDEKKQKEQEQDQQQCEQDEQSEECEQNQSG